ncbi:MULTISPECIES: TetR family transcriptional regulator C-terminal domain-containing protein [unclassified Streptomyces]|uniref:TetR family transcriptional regulator C-terminal domain-containing protein n=1 Tax=unclassified Streptomyces TaxID=2593676 RepID=UPI0027E3DAFC|nr:MULTISPECIES: TetR family transcriptional regulator C-terminal domain-containing protein [unclassified Streptomyces]
MSRLGAIRGEGRRRWSRQKNRKPRGPAASRTNTAHYEHFKDRADLIRRTLAFISDRTTGYTDEATADTEDARGVLLQLLLSELQDTDRVRGNSIAWGELRASAIFDTDLRETLAESTRSWSQDTADAISDAQAAGLAALHVTPLDAAERLTALVEGLSERWLSGSLTLDPGPRAVCRRGGRGARARVAQPE